MGLVVANSVGLSGIVAPKPKVQIITSSTDNVAIPAGSTRVYIEVIGGGGGGASGGPNGSGGGGASHFGTNIHGDHSPGHGGRGKRNDITGINVWYAGGGGGTGHHHTCEGCGGDESGGDTPGGPGQEHRGGGGGGTMGTTGQHCSGGKGGDGICVIRYRCRDEV